MVFLGTVRTGSDAPAATALAVRDGRVLALGDGARALARTADEVIDTGDGLLMAAFGDGHAHPL
ncbi:amidohydrolase, partial [Streptomyces sp. SID10116]|nr:amidohydrolase [Streptomyces sp. SID10116]